MHRQSLDGDAVFLIHDLLAPAECEALVARSEALGYEFATVGGESLPGYRNNARATLTDPALAADLWARAAPHVPATFGGWHATGLCDRFRVYRYETAESFGLHQDGVVTRGDKESRLTFLVYLSAVEQGGETRFYQPGRRLEFTVQPHPGTALVFEHPRLHEGAPVLRGRKYVLRTDVLYRPPA